MKKFKQKKKQLKYYKMILKITINFEYSNPLIIGKNNH